MKKMFALLLILAGSLALLDNLHLFEVRHLMDYLWPSFLILLGLSGLMGKNKNTLFSIILIVLGSIFLAKSFGFLMWVDITELIFPLIVIAIGITLLISKSINYEHNHEQTQNKANYTEYKETRSTHESNQKEYNAILSSRSDKLINKTFKQVTINAILGAAELDLRKIECLDDVAYVDVNCIMGGCDLILPKAYKYIVNGTPIMGGLDNFLESDQNAQKTIEIHYAVVMGGIELRHEKRMR